MSSDVAEGTTRDEIAAAPNEFEGDPITARVELSEEDQGSVGGPAAEPPCALVGSFSHC